MKLILDLVVNHIDEHLGLLNQNLVKQMQKRLVYLGRS